MHINKISAGDLFYPNPTGLPYARIRMSTDKNFEKLVSERVRNEVEMEMMNRYKSAISDGLRCGSAKCGKEMQGFKNNL